MSGEFGFAPVDLLPSLISPSTFLPAFGRFSSRPDEESTAPRSSAYMLTVQKGESDFSHLLWLGADLRLACSLTFPDALPVSEGGLKPSQEISLLSSSSTLGVTEYPLKVSVFTDVVSLSLFFGATEGGEKTRV